MINNNTSFIKKIRVKSRQNCYWPNAEKVLSFVTPSGEQELTKNYKVNTLSFVAFCSLYVQKIYRFIHLLQAKK